MWNLEKQICSSQVSVFKARGKCPAASAALYSRTVFAVLHHHCTRSSFENEPRFVRGTNHNVCWIIAPFRTSTTYILHGVMEYCNSGWCKSTPAPVERIYQIYCSYCVLIFLPIGMVVAWKRAAESLRPLCLEPSIDCRPGRMLHRTRAGSAPDLSRSRALTWPLGELEVLPRLLPRLPPCSYHRWRASS